MIIRTTYVIQNENFVYCHFRDPMFYIDEENIYIYCWLVKPKNYNKMSNRYFSGKDMIAHYVPNDYGRTSELKSDLVPDLNTNPKETVRAINKYIITLISEYYPKLKVARFIDTHL